MLRGTRSNNLVSTDSKPLAGHKRATGTITRNSDIIPKNRPPERPENRRSFKTHVLDCGNLLTNSRDRHVRLKRASLAPARG